MEVAKRFGRWVARWVRAFFDVPNPDWPNYVGDSSSIDDSGGC